MAALAVMLAACGAVAGPAPERRVLVSAAASLTDAFEELAAAFERANPEIDVVLNLAGSSTLREQIVEGAPADVFAAASVQIMEAVVAGGEVAGRPAVFAINHLQIAVPAGNPAGVAGLDDFARTDLLVGLCAAGVPCGDFAREALSRAGVVPAVDTNETGVRALATKIEEGELDAGITYITDVEASGGKLDGIEIPASHNVIAEYPIAVLAGAPNPDGAAAFVAFVLSADGQEILADHGFGLP